MDEKNTAILTLEDIDRIRNAVLNNATNANIPIDKLVDDLILALSFLRKQEVVLRKAHAQN